MTRSVSSVRMAGVFTANESSPRQAKDFVKCANARCPHLTDRRFSGGAHPHCHPVFGTVPADDPRTMLFNF